MQYSDILFQVDEDIALLTLNCPETRNAITHPDTICEIESVCQRVNTDMTIKVLIITGADPAFSSGGNIKDMAKNEGMFKGSPAEIMRNYKKNVQRIPLAVHHVEVPTIAAVNGYAVGAGLDLALMCDMRMASEKAQFGETFLNLGIIPGDGGAYFLPRIVGMAKAAEMTFTGEMIDAEKALAMGLVNDKVPHASLMEVTYALARKISAKPAQALRMAKKLLYMGQDLSLVHLLEQSAAFQALCHHTNDHKEALSAMLAKRPPTFKGN